MLVSGTAKVWELCLLQAAEFNYAKSPLGDMV
jgi:hypothetical protein